MRLLRADSLCYRADSLCDRADTWCDCADARTPASLDRGCARTPACQRRERERGRAPGRSAPEACLDALVFVQGRTGIGTRGLVGTGLGA